MSRSNTTYSLGTSGYHISSTLYRLSRLLTVVCEYRPNLQLFPKVITFSEVEVEEKENAVLGIAEHSLT